MYMSHTKALPIILVRLTDQHILLTRTVVLRRLVTFPFQYLTPSDTNTSRSTCILPMYLCLTYAENVVRIINELLVIYNRYRPKHF